MKILFVNNLQWGDVRGRHHMMYAEASINHDCTVVDVKRILRKRKNPLKNDIPPKFRVAKMYPYQYESKLSKFLTSISYRRCLRDIDTFDVVWIGGPELIQYIPASYKGILIYDCMDNYEQITAVVARRPYIRAAETEAVKRADIVLVSAEVLDEHIKELVPDANTLLVRNAFDGKVIDTPNTEIINKSMAEVSKLYDIVFFGAIAKWVNVELMYKSLDRNSLIRYRLIGNCSVPQYESDRLIYEGVYPHNELFDHVKDADALIMPFYINDLTKAVDPVKLYEYVACGKCIICCYYDEIKRFEPFVYFYHNEDEYYELIDDLTQKGFPPKYNEKEQRDFLEENTWKERFGIVEAKLKEYC